VVSRGQLDRLAGESNGMPTHEAVNHIKKIMIEVVTNGREM
jgi:hypothetical protein